MIGDVLTSTMICDNLKLRYPKATIDFVANENTLAVLENHPHIDSVIVFKNEFRKNKIAFLKFLKEIKQKKYDAVIDAYGKIESNLISLSAKADLKISYTKTYTSWIYNETHHTHDNPDPKMTLAIKNRVSLLSSFKIPENQLILSPSIYLSDKEKEDAKHFLKTNGISSDENIIMISVLGSSNIKTYPAAYMAKVIDTIVSYKPYTILFNYIPSQEQKAKEIFDLCTPKTQKHIKFNIFSNSLRGFLGIVSQCKALIGNEGGAINMAKALQTPTFAIFAPFTGKAGWFIDQNNHKAVHLKDYKPDLLNHLKRKEIIEQIDTFHKEFTPEMFSEYLTDFLKNL
ncbi:heptosyltransferase [Neptunitalea chrysea]|uniref:Heptosyltransferase n=2 Tax=Neptunitalea chrysea TaxID=1647581 RepID=A0A9W6B8Q9_9FLAO|nr:heptosyltransferase [Neptunitalea chrysea]